MTNRYPANSAQFAAVANRPRISAAFALDKDLWDGRKVAVNCIWRGNERRHTRRAFFYGTLDLKAGTPDQIGVRHTDGEVTIIHKTHAVDVYDMTRTRAQAPLPEGPTVAEDLAYVAWVESQDHELPCGCMASDPEHHCEDPIPDDDNPHEERP